MKIKQTKNVAIRGMSMKASKSRYELKVWGIDRYFGKSYQNKQINWQYEVGAKSLADRYIGHSYHLSFWNSLVGKKNNKSKDIFQYEAWPSYVIWAFFVTKNYIYFFYQKFQVSASIPYRK